MYKEPLMIDKYEALQDLYLKDPLKPLKVSKCIYTSCWSKIARFMYTYIYI
jgi:hypothetical protein